MRVLGIEGTAWAASAAVFDSDADDLAVETDPYRPESGGIHPRDAAEHMREAVPGVVEAALDRAAEMNDGDRAAGGDDRAAEMDADRAAGGDDRAAEMDADRAAGGDSPAAEKARDGDGRPPVDAVAFSRGPGLGPCLRVVGTAARALAQALDVPLVGVNHMVAHLEVGRHRSGFASPVCLNASGANAHVLAYRNGRYRVLGETMDTGVGNAIDKFARHVGWSHPGGPKVEEAAREGSYLDLPYVVKGMDFSFSGITSAAEDAADDGEAVEDVCVALQENVFAMLTEVSERALSLTGSDELVLGGGVGRNARLREMLDGMCEARGASFFAPEPELLGDNAGMIAVLGAKMAAAGDVLAVEDSRVDPDFRPDEVPVTWREPDRATARPGPGPSAGQPGRPGSETKGAEATVEFRDGTVRKRRLPKAYRHPDLDRRLRRHRTVEEARLTAEARRHGVPTPVVYDVDLAEFAITFERVGRADLRAVVGGEFAGLADGGDPSDSSAADDRAAGGSAEGVAPARVRDVGRHLAALHDAGFVHGDPTTRNVRVGVAGDGTPGRTYLVDFGLGYYTDDVEDYAMDLHVLAQSLAGTADDPEGLLAAAEDAYRSAGDAAVIDQLRAIEGRGRYR